MTVFYKWGAGIDPPHPTITSAHDEVLVTDDGREIVDAAAGAAVVNLGHSIPDVGDVMASQAEELGYVSTSHFATEPTERLADRITARTPDGLNAVFYVNSGSEANEAAFKLARNYHAQKDRPNKSVVIGRWQSYHGSTLGALSASGNTSRRAPYQALLQEWPHIPPAYPYRWNYAGSPEEQAIAAASELRTAVRQVGPENVAAFIAEPVSGSSIPAAHPHPAYFEEIRAICDEYDVLFIADEVMTGFGRTGEMFAVDRFDVTPDIISVGKGISGGYTPLSATVVHDDIAAEFDAETGGSFGHGHTFSGNPVSCAVASHVVDMYTEDVLRTARDRGQRLEGTLEPLADHPMVGEIRRIGLMVGIEFVADRETKRPFDPDLNVYERVADEAMDRDVYTYPGSGSVDGVAGDHLQLSPPLTTAPASIDRIGEVVVESVEAVYQSL